MINKSFLISIFTALVMISSNAFAVKDIPDVTNVKDIKQLIKEAKAGDVESQKKLGYIYEFGIDSVSIDSKKAVHWYNKAVEQNDTTAMRFLGKMYKFGIGVEEDIDKSRELFIKSAEAGNTTSQILLGIMHDVGDTVPKSDFEAVKWFRKAAEQGNVEGQYFLGVMYELGKGVPEDFVEAFAWYSIATSQGSFTAKQSKEALRDRMIIEDISKAQKLSKQYHDKIIVKK